MKPAQKEHLLIHTETIRGFLNDKPNLAKIGHQTNLLEDEIHRLEKEGILKK